MSMFKHSAAADSNSDDRLEQATHWFLRVGSESAGVEDLSEFKRWIESDPKNELAYKQVSAAWAGIGAHAAAPEIIVARRNALDDARRAANRRWSIRAWRVRSLALAASICVALIGTALYFYLQQGVYSTGLGEQRALRLDDGSLITLDAKSTVRVAYSDDVRLLVLERGRARFDVARDPARPFRVQAGNQTVVAHGTQFNVERVANTVLVTLMEGRVSVTGITPQTDTPAVPAPGKKLSIPVVELSSGQGIQVRANGSATVVRKIDVQQATAWQSGRLFFNNESLASAAERVNRYSKLQVEVDPSVADVGVSGTFTAGDASAFVEAISTYFPVRAEHVSASVIYLTAQD
ncbi:FecR family protein [Steroidobacter flavus]|uniref:FecR family protein n=1 Tax=Steroidobacter flavus TaxID=1842136 RepID=A0ABV8SZP5_9GAMM